MAEQVSESTITFKNISVLQNNLLATTVDQMARDMKFYAVFYVVVGVFYSLTFFGAIYGIPLIIYSIKLKDSAEEYRSFASSKDFFVLQRAMENQRKFFFFNKIIIIIGVVFTLLYLFLIIWFGTSMFFSMPEGNFA